MALARKGTRRIVVDGMAFRWVVAPDDEQDVTLVAERETDPASRLVVWFQYGYPIVPSIVANEIRMALVNGWYPEQRGRDVVKRPSEEACSFGWQDG